MPPRPIAIALASLLFFTGCSDSGPPVRFVVPDGFHGEVHLTVGSDGEEISKEDGRYVIRVPESGQLRVTGFSAFDQWHSQEIFRESGAEIRWMNDGGTGGVAWWGGESTTSITGEAETRSMTFFLGTEEDYRKHKGWPLLKGESTEQDVEPDA